MSNVYDEEKYMIDTTPAVSLSASHFETEFYKTKCFFPEEIIYELRDNKNYSTFLSNVIALDIDVISSLHSNVMPGLPEGSLLVDLYSNKGNGDVLLIATVLSERGRRRGSLFQTKWIIVTEDKGVMDIADKYDIPTIGKDKLKELIEREIY